MSESGGKARWNIGDTVWYHDASGSEVKAEVIEVAHDAMFQVTYDGWGSNWNEVVPLKNIHLSSGEKPKDTSLISLNSKVKVLWMSIWYNATVIAVLGKGVKVETESLQQVWLKAKQILRGQKSEDDVRDEIQVDDRVLYEIGGAWKDGVVSSVCHSFKVTYNGWSKTYDEEKHIGDIRFPNKKRPKNRAQLPVGQKVQCNWYSTWYDATIIGIRSTVAVMPSNDQDQGPIEVDFAKVKKRDDKSREQKPSTVKSDRCPNDLEKELPGKIAITDNDTKDAAEPAVNVGDVVLFKQGQRWKEGKVQELIDIYQVNFDGWDTAHDEEKMLNEIRMRNENKPKGRSELPIGQKIQCEWYSAWYDATITGIKTTVKILPSAGPARGPVERDLVEIKKKEGESLEHRRKANASSTEWPKKKEVPKKAELKPERKSVTKPERKSAAKPEGRSEEAGSAGVDPGVRRKFKVGDTVEVTGTKTIPWLPATVVEVGPKRIFKVTYPGFTSAYDEYVSEVQCQLESGEQVTEATEITQGSQLNCLWGDGTRYPCKVLNTAVGLLRVLKRGYPPGYETWATAADIKELSVTKQDTSFEAMIGKSIADAMSKVVNDASQVKRSTECPAKKVPKETKTQTKPSAKWNQLLSSPLLSTGVANKMKEFVAKERRPPWSGKPLLAKEYQAAICASREDQNFADGLANLLLKRGLKVTVDAEELHDARVFVVIYSDSSSRDENLVRHLTRAAERFNMCETIIVPVIRHHCTAQVVDHIPDNLAYSLSNTVMFNFDFFAEGLPMALKSGLDDVEGVIRNYAEEKTNYDVSGLWLCQAIVDSDLSGFSEIKEFTILINQMGDQIYGKTVDGFQIRGELQGRVFKCRLSYRGEWSQDNVPWKEDDYCFIAEIVAVLHNQGYRLEGECCFVSDVAEKGNEKYLKESGIFNATLEKAGLSGFYNSHWYIEESYEESIAIVHRGGNELIVDFDCSFGTLNDGFYDSTVGTVLMNFADNRHFCQSRLGKLTKDTDGSTAIQFFHYSMENGMTSSPHACAFTRDPVHFLKPKKAEEDSLLMELYNLKPERSLHIPFQPGSYHPLGKNEFAVVICCTRQEVSRAKQLKSVLEKVQEITPVSVNYTDVAKGARCIILLLSSGIQKEPKLIKVIGEAADKEIPIFNIGLDNWFNIFGESKWRDQNLRQDLMNALARLNQTPQDTLDPNHANFRGLVKGIRQHVDPPIFYLSGLWGVEITSEDPDEVIPRYSDLDDSSLQVVHKPSMVFLYFNHLTNKLIMGTDYLVQNMEGWVEPESFTVHLKNAVGKYEMRANEEMDKMYGTYWSQRDNREYRILLTRAEGSLSGIYRWGGDMYVTGIVQVGKSVASVMFGGYTLPAVIDKNQIVFNAPVPLTPHVYITYVAKIAPAPDGNYLAGFAFQSKTMQTRTVFDGMQYTMRPQRVKKEEGAKLSEEEKFVEELAENFWKYLEQDDFAAFHDILSEDSKAAMDEEAFKKERLKHLRLEGKYIPGSLIYIGKKAQHQMGKPVYSTRYDFRMSFEKMKDTEFASLVEDKTKKLATLTSYEEDAVMMHASQYDVMISYRSWDARFIDLLQAFLENKGFSVWRDRRMEVGVNWSEDITRAVRRSSCVLSAISENYLASVLCTKEVRMADDIGKPVIPLILPETCPKDNPMHKLVSAHYKGKTLPHTIAHELSTISWCDMRPEAHLDIPDPKDVASFEAKYNKVLTSVIRIISEIVLHSKVLDLKGKWTLDVGSGPNKHSYSMVIVANDGTSIEGVLTSTRFGDINIPIEAKRSWCVGSHFYLEATIIRDKKSNTIKIEAKVDSSGEEFVGTMRFHDSLWDYPDGQPFNALLAMTYKQVDNDSTVYSVKGTRTSVFTKDPTAGAEFVVDLERATAILREAFPDTDKEQLETSIVALLKAFKKYDTNESNALDLSELDLALRVAKCTLSEDDKKSILSELDMDNSGTLDFYEFMTFFAKVRQRKLDQGSVSASVVQQGVIPKVCCVQ